MSVFLTEVAQYVSKHASDTRGDAAQVQSSTSPSVRSGFVAGIAAGDDVVRTESQRQKRDSKSGSDSGSYSKRQKSDRSIDSFSVHHHAGAEYNSLGSADIPLMRPENAQQADSGVFTFFRRNHSDDKLATRSPRAGPATSPNRQMTMALNQSHQSGGGSSNAVMRPAASQGNRSTDANTDIARLQLELRKQKQRYEEVVNENKQLQAALSELMNEKSVDKVRIAQTSTRLRVFLFRLVHTPHAQTTLAPPTCPSLIARMTPVAPTSRHCSAPEII